MFNISKLKTLAVVASALSTLYGCGGGGGTNSPEQISEGNAIYLSFDDAVSIKSWHNAAGVFIKHGATATFFVEPRKALNDLQVGMLHDLEDMGFEIGFHSTTHKNALEYVEKFGIVSWYEDEILKGMEVLQGYGFAPKSFAYPYGRGNEQTDTYALNSFSRVRYFTTVGGENVAVQDIDTPNVTQCMSIDQPYFNMDKVKKLIDAVSEQDGKSICMASHVIYDEEVTSDYTGVWKISIQDLDELLGYAKSKGFVFKRMRD